jgi:hypothetical protein
MTTCFKKKQKVFSLLKMTVVSGVDVSGSEALCLGNI